jgi:hypothetical protein
MQVSSRSTGAGIGTLGAVLVLCGAFPPTYGSGDYERAGFGNAPVFLLAALVAPALLVLVISVFVWFRPLPRWLVVLCVVIAILAVVVHLLGSLFSFGLACFDVCPLGGVHFGTGFWLPLVGFPLSALGLAAVAAAEKRRSLPGPPAASP